MYMGENKKVKRVSTKVAWYFPIIPRLRQLFVNKANAELLQWHTRERKKDAMLPHPADGIQWRNFDRKHKDFAAEVRNIRFGLSTDGMDTFGETESSHSIWPITLCIYNLLSWLCMKRKIIMTPLLISGPVQVGNDIDVYLQPLIDDLLVLWKKEGVRMWDEFQQQHFNLRAIYVIGTFSLMTFPTNVFHAFSETSGCMGSPTSLTTVMTKDPPGNMFGPRPRLTCDVDKVPTRVCSAFPSSSSFTSPSCSAFLALPEILL
jgi:hypothetical protein